MRNKKTHSLTKKKRLTKCKYVFYAYNDLQYEYGKHLDRQIDIAEIQCNVDMSGCELGDNYTTDFYCIKTDGSVMVRECVYRDKFLKPMVIKALDASYKYWTSRGVKDWGVVFDDQLEDYKMGC